MAAMGPKPLPRMTDDWANAVVAFAARLRGVKLVQIMRNNQKRDPSHARFGVIWVMKRCGYTLADIADHLGQADHTATLYGLNVANRLRVEDQSFRRYTDDLLLLAMNIRPETDAEAA